MLQSQPLLVPLMPFLSVALADLIVELLPFLYLFVGRGKPVIPSCLLETPSQDEEEIEEQVQEDEEAEDVAHQYFGANVFIEVTEYNRTVLQEKQAQLIGDLSLVHCWHPVHSIEANQEHCKNDCEIHHENL